jgi:glycosyltransferase involved in cell wall biosynthesis
MLSNNNPLVSIIITSYNRASAIEEAINSALAQDYNNIEVVISDNASTDNTDAVLSKYKDDERVKCFKNEINVGAIPNYKKASHELAKGEYVVYVSSDDYLISNNFISKSVELINKYEDIIIVKGYEAQFNESTGQKTFSKDTFKYKKEFYTGEEMFWFFAELKMGWGGIMIHRGKLIEDNLFDNANFSFDFEVNLCMYLKGNVAIIDETVYLFKIHPNQDSSNVNIERSIENFYFVDKAYDMALQKGFDKQRLQNWKLAILSSWSLIYMYSYFDKNKTLYKNFMQLLQAKQPEVYAQAVTNKKWKLFKIIMNFSPVSFPLLRIFFPVKYKYYQLLKAKV